MVCKKPPSATRIGVGTVALAIGRGLRALRGALGTIGVFRPVRGAGVSLAAASGSFARCGGREFRAVRGATGGAAPWTPATF